MITELKYGNTNTYLIKGTQKYILFDTDWAGTFASFCCAIKEKSVKLCDIEYLFISHFHPDHMGLAGLLAEKGVKIAVIDLQKDFIHISDRIFQKENNKDYIPIDETKIITLKLAESRKFLSDLGISGEIIHTPGHSDDSISVCLDDGTVLVGDLNPLYELPFYKDTAVGESWNKILAKNPRKICYGHAKTTII